MSQYASNKNTPPPWAQTPGMLQRPAAPQQLMQPQLLVQQQLQQPGQVQYGLQFQQQQGLGSVSLGAPGIALPTTLATTQPVMTVGSGVQYPTRGLGQSTAYPAQQLMQGQQQQPKQRVFTGTITKLHDNFGFVDEDVFFQTNCIRGSVPKVGERVLVEAQYNANMPFKWNATRIQLLPNQGGGNSAAAANSTSQLPSLTGSSLTGLAGPPGVAAAAAARSQALLTRGPPGLMSNKGTGAYSAVPPPSDAMPQATPLFGGRMPHSGRPRSPLRRVRAGSRDKDRRRSRDRDDSSSRRRSRSRSPRRRGRVARYSVHVPKITLDLSDASVLTLKKRYNNLYIPSDFFLSRFHCAEVFPLHRPFQLAVPVSYHVMSKDVDPIQENDAVYEPADVDYKFCAKVMLVTTPGWEEMYRRTCALAEEEEEDADLVHPSRVVSFLVGLRGKNETMAIGGPWSPSLDGADPEGDPQVLIRTAVRTCRALTGIDLSCVTKWYRLAEIFYRRGGRSTETVVLYLPDTAALAPPRVAWERTTATYRQQLQTKLNPAAAPASDDKEEETEEVPVKVNPTHWSELDPRSMKVAELKQELELRTMSPKGLKSQLIARLTKVLKTEEEKEEEEKASGAGAAAKQAAPPPVPAAAEKDKEEENSDDEETKRKEEAEKRALEKKYVMPESPHVVVHPHRTAKSGKFDCTVMSLSVLLDYRQEDNKEHSFEVSLFAEIFNEMLMRDAGFTIYRALVDAPEKPKEDKKSAKKDDKSDDKTAKDDDKSAKDDKDVKEGGDDVAKDADAKREESGEEKTDPEEAEANLYTANRPLLMAFSYFDTSHCGYVIDKDLEEIIYTVGLGVSRAQTRKLVGRAADKDSVYYRQLTDRPVPEDGEPAPADTPSDATSELLAQGNHRHLPAFASTAAAAAAPGSAAAGTGSQSLVTYQGSLVDVGALLSRVAAADATLQQTERRMEQLQEEARSRQSECSGLRDQQERLTAQLDERRDQVTQLERELTASRTTVGKYGTALDACYAAVAPLVAEAESRAQAELEGEGGGVQDEEADADGDEASSSDVTAAADDSKDVKQEAAVKQEAKEERSTKKRRKSDAADPSPKKSKVKAENGDAA